MTSVGLYHTVFVYLHLMFIFMPIQLAVWARIIKWDQHTYVKKHKDLWLEVIKHTCEILTCPFIFQDVDLAESSSGCVSPPLIVVLSTNVFVLLIHLIVQIAIIKKKKIEIPQLHRDKKREMKSLRRFPWDMFWVWCLSHN